MVAGLGLLLVYVALSFLNDPAGYLSTDTGLKVATVQAMVDNATFDPDIGYWAAPWDPDATVHGYLDTYRVDDRYIDATSLPMILLARPLWALGGYRAALLLPMLGAVACAFEARAFSRRLGGGDGDGWLAFWVIGLATPLAIYALDFWEHTIGVALMGAGVLVLYDAIECRPTWWRGALAGLAFGAAFSMRTEALVYTATTFAIAGVVLWSRRGALAAVRTGVLGVAGFVVAFVANATLEGVVLGQSSRSGRAVGASGGVLSEPVARLREAAITTLSPFPTDDPSFIVVAAVLAAALIVWARQGTDPSTRVRAQIAVALAVAIYVYRLSYGAGFWPGLLATTPFAAVALALGWRRGTDRLVLLFALVPLPLVLASQFLGGALPQWAGRYLLVSGFLLAVVGVSRSGDLVAWVRTGFVLISVAVTAVGLLWLAERSHAIADAGRLLADRPEAVLISPDAFPPREFAATYAGSRWLAFRDQDLLDDAVGVVRDSGLGSFAIVSVNPEREFPDFEGFEQVGREQVPYVGGQMLTLTTYRATS